MWMACSRRESIHRAARHGLGALTFAFVEPEQAAKWVQEYYDIIRSEECVPVSHVVNPNIALVSGMSLHEDEQEAIRRGLDGFRFFGYSLGYYGLSGAHRPGRTSVWENFAEVRNTLPDNAGRGGIGTPDQVREHLLRYERTGVDQIIFVQQSGTNRHEHICDSLELFAAKVMPEFHAEEAERQRRKQAELAPYKGASVGVAQASTFNDRGGAISVPRFDPHAAPKGEAG
jgi:alkanesulfonate monooxygenase SsuD/methylene tetrahydromethanopterin reductase-like flavin-dependent oxidoreductase (luciferase family)